uniref:Uncharacterized protein n=1 Tax=Heterorhabditis bacteriophora TaxID=37862 RepID=A0A1I7XCU8_HETBA
MASIGNENKRDCMFLWLCLNTHSVSKQNTNSCYDEDKIVIEGEEHSSPYGAIKQNVTNKNILNDQDSISV